MKTVDRPEPSAASETFWKMFLRKMAVALRIFGKEIYREKLEWLDLRRADVRLGQTAYANRSTLSGSRIVDRLSQIGGRIEALNQPINSGPSFKEKLKVAVKGAGRATKIQILKRRRNRMFRKLGTQIRQSEDHSADTFRGELGKSRTIAATITELTADIDNLASRTFFWARKPLLTSSIVLAAVLLSIGIVHQQAQTADRNSSNRHPGLLGWLAQAGGTAPDATAWASSYRNAKFLTRAEFIKNIGPVRLVVRQGSGLSESVSNVEEVVRTSASAHGWTITSQPTGIEMIVDADMDRSKITTTEYTNFGPREQEGYFMAYQVNVQVGFQMKVNCRRGDKFVEVSACPARSWSAYHGCMGDLVDFNATYAKAFRLAVDGVFEKFARTTDADDSDDRNNWDASLWPASRDREMFKNVVSPMTADPRGSDHRFYGVTNAKRTSRCTTKRRKISSPARYGRTGRAN